MITSSAQEAARIYISIFLLFWTLIITFFAESFAAPPFEYYNNYCRQELNKGRDPRIYDNGRMVACSLYLQRKELIEKVARKAAEKGLKSYRINKSKQQADKEIRNEAKFQEENPQPEETWQQRDKRRESFRLSRQEQPKTTQKTAKTSGIDKKREAIQPTVNEALGNTVPVPKPKPTWEPEDKKDMLNFGIWHWFSIALLLFFTAGIVTGKASQLLRKITCQFQKEICPYCFDYFWIHETPFRCTSPMARCAPVKDAVLEKVWGDARPVGKVLSPTGRFSSSTLCIDCGQQTPKRLCPHCHMELPHTTGQFKNYIFSVIGAKDSGKSHYLAVLINQIRKRLGPDMNMLLEPMNDDTIKRYRKDFYEPIYHDKRVIFGTTSALADRKVQQPLVYSLSMSGKSIFGNNRIKKAVILVFFDTAGEDLNDEDVMSTVNKYIYRSDGILLLVDPLQLQAVRDQVAPTTPLPQINTETADILNRTTRLIERGHSMQPTDVVKIPLAVSFSKFDAVLPLVDPHFQLHASANHDGGFDIDDFEAVNAEMMALLDKWNGQDILQLARTRYRRYGFFGLTALGCNPHDSKKISRLLPRRIEDPFLWLLAQNNIIRKVRHK